MHIVDTDSQNAALKRRYLKVTVLVYDLGPPKIFLLAKISVHHENIKH